MIIALILALTVGFIAGALVFRNNADKINDAVKTAEDKANSVIDDIKK